MGGRAEHKKQSETRMRKYLADKPDYLSSFYDRLFLSEQYLTAQNYTLTVARFFNYVGSESISDFNGDNIVSFLLHLPGRAGGESSDSVKITTWCALNKFGEFLLLEGEIKENPLNKVPHPAMHDNPEPVYMTEKELNEIVECIKRNSIGTSREKARRQPWIERNLAIIELLLVTGMRVTALTELDMADYDRINKKITVIEKRGELIHYPLTIEVMAVLESWLEKRERLLCGRKCNAFFISNRRARLTAKGVADIIRVYTTTLEKHITPHKFRSTYAILVFQVTGDVRYVQACLNHKHADTTNKYIKGFKFDTRKAAEIATNVLH